MKNIIEKVADKNGVTKEEVENEIRKTIEDAMTSRQPEAQRFWKEIAPDGQIPSVETVITSIINKVKEQM